MTEGLIELVKKHPVLYNTQCGGYRDFNAKAQAWETIAKLQNTSVEDCKEAWTKLRNCYTNAMKRRRLKAPRILALWRYEKQMAFLKPFVESNDGSHLVKTSVFIDENDDFDTDTFDGEQAVEERQTDTKVFDNFPEQSTPNLVSSKRFKSSHSAINECSTEMTFEDTFKKDKKSLDENDMFFLSMSQTVKRLPKIDQAGIKLKLHQMVFEAEERMLQNT